MSFLWDLLQQNQISKASSRTDSIEERLDRVEADVTHLSNVVHELIVRLEARLGTDLDQDGRVG